eukprot:TRINITY_DN5080_c0_g2_i3.p1 TRINITY_DN5080_c0_g2~~TRINITY_DN5080_c0_g2_i3.p1  ORF type:complete len:620 (+),score=62.24 TRINITY_DN5080_c0_g2_i3:58-1917(+)
MEVTRDNFTLAYNDIAHRLPSTAYIAIDLELTGIGRTGNRDHFWDLSAERLERACEVAEHFAVMQLGLTLCQMSRVQAEEMTTYNIIMAPRSRFLGEASALHFVRNHGGDLNAWVDKGVRLGYHREDFVDFCFLERGAAENTLLFREWGLHEARKMGIDLNKLVDEDDIGTLDPTMFWHSEPNRKNTDGDYDPSSGFIRLWYLLRFWGRPVVVHGSLDVFFLLSSFEMQRLPRSPYEFARLAKSCFPGGIYDTSHLHEAIDDIRFLPMKLQDYHRMIVQRCCSVFSSGYTSFAYSGGVVHQAGFDSLLTADIFRCLRLLYGDRVDASKDRLYLHNCGVSLDLGRALRGENPDGSCFGDDLNLTLLVAVMHTDDARQNTPFRISECAKQDRSFFYRRTSDARFLLVVLRCSGSCAASKADKLGALLPGVTWIDFDTWKYRMRRNSSSSSRISHLARARNGASSCVSSPPSASQSGAERNRHTTGSGFTRLSRHVRPNASQPVLHNRTYLERGRCSARASQQLQLSASLPVSHSSRARNGASSSTSSQPSASQSGAQRHSHTTGHDSARVSIYVRPNASQPVLRNRTNLKRGRGRARASQQLPAPLPVGRVTRPDVNTPKP